MQCGMILDGEGRCSAYLRLYGLTHRTDRRFAKLRVLQAERLNALNRYQIWLCLCARIKILKPLLRIGHAILLVQIHEVVSSASRHC